MKIDVINKDKGILYVDSKEMKQDDVEDYHDLAHVDVSLGNMVQWYPFSFLYFYELSTKHGIVLRRQNRAQYPVYGTVMYPLSKYTSEWGEDSGVNLVYKRNKQVVNFAHHLGISVMGDTWHLHSLEKDFSLLSSWQVDKEKSVMEREKINNCIPGGEFGPDEIDDRLFSYFNDEDLKQYHLSGELYAMLVMRKKIEEAENRHERVY